jgi:prephenate dehydrogenase
MAKEKHLISSETLNLDNLDDLLVIFCTPVLSIQAALNSFLSLQPSQNFILTDTLSTKRFFNEMLRKEFPELKDKFVSSHPIAGSEKSGLIHSKKDLFEGRISVITPNESNNEEDIARIINFWKSLGSDTKILTQDQHDFIFAKTSHLPHVISYALTRSLFDQLKENTFEYSGGSLEDYTRIASSDPTMWKDIFVSNKSNIISSIEEFEDSLSELKELINDGNEEGIIEFLDNIKKLRDSSILDS